jgi:hypothetical protein
MVAPCAAHAEQSGVALAGGYAHGFDLELIGPRIEKQGRLDRPGAHVMS